MITTKLDQLVDAVAELEGWAIFNEPEAPEVQRDDEVDKFASDEDALAHVRALALRGSALHRRALQRVGVTP